MRILQVINNLGSGGAEKLISDLAPLMKDEGHDIEVLLLQMSGSIYIDSLLQKGIKVRWLNEKGLHLLSNIFAIRKFIVNGKYDVVNVHIFPSLYVVALASFLGLGNTRLFYTEHNTNNRRRKYLFFKVVDRLVYRRYHKIIAITAEVKDQLDRHLGEKNSNSSIVINNGVDVDKIKKAETIDPSDLYGGYRNDHRLICMVGRFSQAKDQATLIKSMREIPDNVHLLLIGDGALLEEKKALSCSLGVHHRVHFLGLRKNVPEILKACDIGILSSNWEGMPIAALEIFAAGIPFIGSDVKGINDLFYEYNNLEVCLFENKNYIELANLIIMVLTDASVRRKNLEMSEKIVSKYTIKKMADNYLSLYRESDK